MMMKNRRSNNDSHGDVNNVDDDFDFGDVSDGNNN